MRLAPAYAEGRHSLIDHYLGMALKLTRYFSMASSTQTGTSWDHHSGVSRGTANRRRQPLRISVFHRDTRDVERCLQELEGVEITVNSDLALDAGALAKHMGSQHYDLIEKIGGEVQRIIGQVEKTLGT